MALEDPFDNLGLDGIYIDEAVFDVEQVLLHANLHDLQLFSACSTCHRWTAMFRRVIGLPESSLHFFPGTQAL